MKRIILFGLCILLLAFAVRAEYLDVNWTLKVTPINKTVNGTSVWDYSVLEIITESETYKYNITDITKINENFTQLIWREVRCEETELLNVTKKLINLTEASADCREIYIANGRLSEALLSCSKESNPLCYNYSQLYQQCINSKSSLNSQISTLREEKEACENSKIWYALGAGGIVLFITFSLWKKPYQPAKPPIHKDFPDYPG